MNTATSAVVQVGKHGGRGFIVAAGERRYVVTAAHCVGLRPPMPVPHRANGEVTYQNFVGPLGGERRVWAECLFMDPIADIAVFGAPDAYERAAAYEALTGHVAFRIGKLDFSRRRKSLGKTLITVDGERREVTLPPPAFLGTAFSEAHMLSLKGEWFTCRIMSSGGALRFDRAAKPVVGGMSGSPIVLPDGSAVGVVCTSEEGGGGREGGPNPMLTAHLPGWLLAEA